VTGTPTAADLLALDGKTSVVVDVKSASITGTAADVKKLLASKGVSLAKDVNITLDSDTEVSAADLNAIAKATGGKVTATAVAAGTAAALNKALGNATKDDIITLKVSGKTATAADLLALDGKTSKAVNAAEVESITGTVADLKKVFTAAQLVAPTIELADEVAVSVSGTVKASDLKDVLSAADGIVTATVAAGKAADLATNLADDPENALKVTITDTKVDAEHLLALDGATSIAVNAASVKTITGDAADVKKAYEAGSDKGISGLGNEAVDLTDATDANAELVSAINDFTTGLIKLPTVTFTNEVATTFSLSDLGDLNGITGLANINADNGQNDTISISLKDLLAANDSKDDFTFTITSDNDKSDSVIFTDTAGWTKDATGFVADTGGNITFTNNTNDQVITITLDNVVL
jgi:DNA-binding transcriptional regulator YdaS (Cro superfamily)